MAKPSAFAFKQWVNSQGNQKLKLTKEERTKEYNRIRKNLERSIRRYEQRGLDTSFFELPDRPKDITEGSIRRIKQKEQEWRYLTGQKVDLEEIPPTWEKTSKEARDFRSQNTKWLQAQALERKRQEEIEKAREDMERANEDNEWWKRAQEEGYDFSDLPSDTENYAIKILEIALDALDPEESTTNRYHAMTKRKYNRTKAYSFTANQKALFTVVQKKAQLSIQKFRDMGIPTDPQACERYSKNLAQNFYDIAIEFEQWLWESDQYTNPNMSGLEMVVRWMTKKNILSGKKRKALGNLIEEEDI